MMRDPDFERWCNVNIPNESMDICNSIIPPDEQRAIEDAAHHEHNGYTFAAEQARHRGGYGSSPGLKSDPPHGGYPDPDPEDYDGA